MDVSDCITILGNLLDNAIAAVILLPETGRFLHLKVVYDRGRLIIRCENPYCNKIIYQNGRIVSTKHDKAEHGIGLRSVERIITKSRPVFTTSRTSCLFMVHLF